MSVWIALISLSFGICVYCCPCLVETRRTAPWFLRSDGCPQIQTCSGYSRPAPHSGALNNDTVTEAWALGYGKQVLPMATYKLVVHGTVSSPLVPWWESYPQGVLEELALVEISGTAATLGLQETQGQALNSAGHIGKWPRAWHPIRPGQVTGCVLEPRPVVTNLVFLLWMAKRGRRGS